MFNMQIADLADSTINTAMPIVVVAGVASAAGWLLSMVLAASVILLLLASNVNACIKCGSGMVSTLYQDIFTLINELHVTFSIKHLL